MSKFPILRLLFTIGFLDPELIRFDFAELSGQKREADGEMMAVEIITRTRVSKSTPAINLLRKS